MDNGGYPYLLPCIVIATVQLVGFVTGLVFLPETLNGRARYLAKTTNFSSVAEDVISAESPSLGVCVQVSCLSTLFSVAGLTTWNAENETQCN